MQQSPEPVTQTINRVIEKTVETVTQQPVQDIKDFISQKPTPQKDVVTVVVNQEDQTINAVAKNENSIARIHVNNKTQEFVTLGIVLNAAGDILVDKRMIDRRGTYLAYYGTRKIVVKSIIGTETPDFITLRIQGDNPNDFTPITFGDSNGLKVGQSVISLSGSQSTSVAIGEVNSLSTGKDGNFFAINTSVNPLNVLNGSVLLNLQGSVVGIKIFPTEDRTVFLPINILKAQIASAP